MAKTRHLKNRKTGKSFCGRPMTDAGFDCTTCQVCADAKFKSVMNLPQDVCGCAKPTTKPDSILCNVCLGNISA